MKGMTARAYRFGEFRLDLATRSLCCGGIEVALPPKALDCLGYLVEHPDRAVGRDELIGAVWGRVDISDNALGQAILQARRALRTGSAAAAGAIRTVPRFGYHWQMPVAVDEPRVPDNATPEPGPVIARPSAPTPVVTPETLQSARIARSSRVDTKRYAVGRYPGRSRTPRLAWLVVALALLVLALGPAIPVGTRSDADVPGIDSRDHIASSDVDAAVVTAPHAQKTRRSDAVTRPKALAADTPGEGWLARLAAIDAALVSGRVDDARSELARMDARDRERPDVRYQVARLDFMEGRLDVAQERFQRLLEALPPTRQPLLRARVFNALGNLAYMRRDNAEVLAQSDAAIQALTDQDEPAELGRAWVGRASAHTSLQQFTAALADYARARVAFSEAGDQLALARVDAYQGLLEVTRNRPADALPMLAGAANRLQDFEAVIEELHARVGLVYAYLALSRPADAYAQNTRLAKLGARVGDVRRRHYAEFARVRSLTATGRLDAAEALLATLRSSATSRPGVLLDNNRMDLPILATQLAFARDDVAPALPEARHALTLAGGDDAGDRAMAHLLNWQLQVRLGQLDQAGRIARAADRDDPGMPPGTRIRLALLEAGQAELEGDGKSARAAFDRALAMAEDYRVPAELVQVAQPFVRFLLTQGDRAYASVVAGRVAGWASVDYTAALVQVELYGALDQSRAWSAALQQARSLAGERSIPPALAMVPGARTAAGPGR